VGIKNKNLSIIDKDLKVEGELACDGKIVIKGTVKGSISGESVIIAEEGNVFSDMKVEDITIGGCFEGKITAAGKVIVLSSGKCTGVVTCNDLIVESGGIINAEVMCTKDCAVSSKDGFHREKKASVKKIWGKKNNKTDENLSGSDKEEKFL